jgi:ferredoxin
MDAVIDAALGLGWAKERVHYERFGAPKSSYETAFEVECRRSRRRLVVAGGETLLDALERENIDVPFACRAGSCGVCTLPVLEGEIEHRDDVLTAEERREGRKIAACISRGRTKLVLDV